MATDQKPLLLTLENVIKLTVLGGFFAGSSDLEPVMRQALMDLFA